jgi:hypothetical protein
MIEVFVVFLAAKWIMVLHNPFLCLDEIKHFIIRVFHPPTLVCPLDSSRFIELFHQLMVPNN